MDREETCMDTETVEIVSPDNQQEASNGRRKDNPPPENVGAKSLKQKLDVQLDRELEDTFPASDPPKIVQPKTSSRWPV